jgi:hypothetical protein
MREHGRRVTHGRWVKGTTMFRIRVQYANQCCVGPLMHFATADHQQLVLCSEILNVFSLV